MFSKKNKKKGFTLVEMLIVIVIIGILAAALIPRLTSARGRANDVARKADLQQIMTALISYQIDNGSFPATAKGTSSMGGTGGELTLGGMSSVPSDPANATLSGGISITLPAGSFGYQPVTKNGQTAGGFVLMTTMETEGSANYVVCPSTTNIQPTDNFSDIQNKVCSKVTVGSCAGTTTGGACTDDAGKGQLRYIVIY